MTDLSEYDCGILSEPRIMEYLKKRKYYAENNITPCIPLEAEYSITQSDYDRLKKSRALLTTRNKYFPPTKYETIEPKIQYKTPLHYEVPIPCDEAEHKKYRLPHNPQQKKVRDYTKRETEVPAFLSRMIEKPSSRRTYDCNPASKLNPGSCTRMPQNSNPNSCINTIREQFYTNVEMDPDILSDMKLGMPIRTRKTYGFDDPFEHYYDYIDGDMQLPEHVVMDFPRGGESSRLANTKQKTRVIM